MELNVLLQIISGLLITVGLISIFIEVYTPGYGIFGSLGTILLIVFFSTHIYYGNSNYLPMVMFFVGIILLILEIFVIPGFGIAGILGVILSISSLFWAFGWENITSSALIVSLSLILAVIAITSLTLYVLPKTKIFDNLSLKSVSGNIKSQLQAKNSADSELIGKIAKTISPLKPNGKIVLDNITYDAISEQNFIPLNSEVEITGVSAFELKVRAYKA